MLIINQQKKIFIAKRIDSKGNTWQMPQGGIDLGETPSRAVMREMQEEIGCNQAQIIVESKHWYSYRIPAFLVPKLWDGQFHGQAQKWFLMQFLGKDGDINLDTKNPEFCEWQWIKLDQLVHTVVPFKRKLYKTIVNEFKSFLT